MAAAYPYFFLEAVRVEKAEFSGGPFGTPVDWFKAMLDLQGTSSRYLVNLGAHLTASDVVAMAMKADDAEGIAIDSDDKMAWTGKRIATHTGIATPRNINALLDAAAVPRRPLLLKVDIDSYDVDVALAVLTRRSPDFIFVEHNVKAPPPVCYCNRYSRHWRRLGSQHYGCTLSGFVHAFAPTYALVSVLFNDALFVHERLRAQMPRREGLFLDPSAAYRTGYSDVRSRKRAFFWGKTEGSDALTDASVEFAVRAPRIAAFFSESVRRGFADFSIPAGGWPCNRSAF